MKTEVIKTEDGSHTLFVPELDEHYHSTHGAVQESKHVFLKYGLEEIKSNELSVFEVGFGTGLNAILAYESIQSTEKKICYHAIEKYPVANEIIEQLNYTNFFGEQHLPAFLSMHNATWGEECSISENFTLKKIEADLLSFKHEQQYDLIFFDAFAPSKQSEMWSEQVFELMGKMCKAGGILTTYSSKGDVKRALRAAGFQVKKKAGPPGKRDMIQAIKLPTCTEQ